MGGMVAAAGPGTAAVCAAAASVVVARPVRLAAWDLAAIRAVALEVLRDDVVREDLAS
jgi:hypothetical protein